ncbi:amidohydrolase family protein [Euzebya pacifica]|uniref:amidohydrolase family protein n=1 Tax=Euzebya pacifica TaxID=1608957 RepID=UPI0030F8197D
MSGPPLADGAVLVADGVIVAVGHASDLTPSADRHHHLDGVLLPGLVDGHTVLEHSDVRAIARPGPFHMWLRAVLGYTRGWDGERWMRSAHRGVQDALRHGVTTVVDSVVRGPAVPAAGRAGLRGHSLVQVMMVDITEHDAVLEAVRTSLQRPANGRTVGIAPHSSYTLGTGVMQALGALAREFDRPLQIRAAESNAEIAAIRQGDGPLVDLATEAGMDVEWAPDGVGKGAIGYLDSLDLLGPGTSVVHGVWADLAEARILARAGVPVVCCPRANTMLQVGEAPLERFAEAGTPLALGTGSAAAAGDADLLADAAAWAQVARNRELVLWPSPSAGPISLEEAAIRLATVDGARALGLGDTAGILEAGRPADMVGVALETTPGSVYRDLVERGPGRQVLTVLGGLRKSRRNDPDVPWPELEEWKDL